jgi:hypothetical protein
MPTTTISTDLLESVNIVLANLGESPLPENALSSVLPKQAEMALDTIEEVSNDIQSKGWWFNQKTDSVYSPTANVVVYENSSTAWASSIPEEARRYITIRAARIAQTRFIGSEELQKFSYNEELVSLAILQQAHVRNSNGVLGFASFPAELRELGIDEVMFLQGNIEEKLGTLRLGGELATIAKTKAETALIADQEALVTNQAASELKTALKLVADTTFVGKQGLLVDKQALDAVADTTLKGKQGLLVDKQALDAVADTTLKGKQGLLVDKQALDVVADTTLKGKQGLLVDAQELKTDAETTLTSNQSSLVASQKTQLDAQTAIEAAAEKAFYDGVVAGTQNTYRDFAAEMRIMGIQENTFQQIPAYKKIELLSDASKLRAATATETGANFKELFEVNKVMRFIGEPKVAALNSNSLASECVRLLRDTDAELQGRGWWFNTETDVELTLSNNRLVVPSDALSVELNDYSTRIITVSNSRYVYDLKEKSYTSWNKEEKAKVIYQRELNDTPSKYLEYLNVRVAILLTELYPKSGIDIQRLPKMEQELRAYFKSREADEANYSIFDNIDTAARIGINRNYSII